METTCLTADSPGNNQLLYFTSTSLTSDGRTLVMISDRSGDPNLVARDLSSGRERVLTDNREGWLKSYVYFDGRPGVGFARASISLDAPRGIAYYIQGRELRAVDLDGAIRVLAQIPDGQVTAFTHVSGDGRYVCVPTTDARALDGPITNNKPDHNIDARVVAEGLNSYLRVFDTQSGVEVACAVVPRGWVTHVQFAPDDNSRILYNHEWTATERGIRRMWLWDGKQHHRLRSEGPGRSRDDWACHEMWADGGRCAFYHGGFNHGASFVGRWQRDSGALSEVALPTGWKRYGHFTADPTGNLLVSDGYYQQADDPIGDAVSSTCGVWISLQRVDWQAKTIAWTPLCRHGSSWKSQDAHPHPIFDHTGQHVLFTSDVSGRRAVYRIGVPKTG
ncbi:MAG: oligogalacturonate lyase family protein [Planctomycetota bacterium]